MVDGAYGDGVYGDGVECVMTLFFCGDVGIVCLWGWPYNSYNLNNTNNNHNFDNHNSQSETVAYMIVIFSKYFCDWHCLSNYLCAVKSGYTLLVRFTSSSIPALSLPAAYPLYHFQQHIR